MQAERFQKQTEYDTGDDSDPLSVYPEQISQSLRPTLGQRQAELEAQLEHRYLSRNFHKFQDDLQISHKFLYSVLVVTGIVLFWYGAWTLIRTIPFLSNGFFALALGLLLLFITGAVYKKLAG